MNFRHRVATVTLAAGIAGLSHSFAPGVAAQDLYSIGQDMNSMAAANAAFDQQQNATLQYQMQQLQQARQQLRQSFIQQHGPQLQQEYQQFIQSTGYQIPFETFVDNYMATAGGTNPGPALQQQQRNFQALQDANRSLQQGYDSYNQGWRDNQQRMDNAFQRYDQQAIRGNAYYGNPQTGNVYELPYGGSTGVYGSPGGTIYTDQSGNYQETDPQGYGTQLQQENGYSGYGYYGN
mgnify:CR=1 FL=1